MLYQLSYTPKASGRRMADRVGNQARISLFCRVCALQPAQGGTILPGMNDFLPDDADPEVLLAAAPWNLDATRAAEAEIGVPTMLAPEERRLYHWAGQHWARDAGALVDLGAFAGGSTARLAAGVAARGGVSKVHAFDRFGVDERTKRRILYAQNVPPFDGTDILPLAKAHLAPWADRVVFHQGLIEEMGWSGGLIEVLAVDAGKKAWILDAIAAQFYPALLPGRSLLIHQDFLHWTQPWLTAQMTRLGDCLKPVAFARDNTVVFLCTASVTAERLAAARVANLSDAEIERDVIAMRDLLAPWGFSARFEAARAALRATPGERVAWKMRRTPRPAA